MLFNIESFCGDCLRPAESFFDGLLIDGEAAYFTTSCDQVTGDTLAQVQRAFIDMLRSRGK